MKKHIEIMAGVMIWLVLMLPVAFAQQITVQKFAGVDNVKNFARENDILTIQALVQLAGSPSPDVARQRVRVYNDDTYAFMDSCTPESQSTYYKCTYTTTDLIYGGKDEYAIRVFNADGTEVTSKTEVLTVDFIAPRVTTFSISPNLTTSAVPTTITYKVEDYGTETGKTTNCAGTKSINFTANNMQVGTVTAGIGNCTKEGTFTFTPTVSGSSAGLTVCAVATDYLNHKSTPVCKPLLIDSQKPIAQALELRDNNGFVLSHARTGQAITADVFVKIPDVDIDPTKVFADLSKLNPNLGKIVRQDKSGEWFIWRNIQVATPQTCQVIVEATDYSGNKETKTLTCSVGIDDTGPVATVIKTQFVDEDNTPLLSTNGTIQIDFTEAGSGLDKGNAYLDLRKLGSGTSVKANKCEKASSDKWTCSWNVRPTVTSGTYDVQVLPTTRDDVDNQLSGSFTGHVRFDNAAPSGIRLKEIVAFRPNRVPTEAATQGETVEFVVEGTGFTATTADFTSLGGNAATSAEQCIGTTTKTCSFSTTVSNSGPQATNVTFKFSDIAGNKATLTTNKFFILAVKNEANPNYWTLTTTCSPPLLDRQTLSVFAHPVYCKLKLTSTNSQAKTISINGPADIAQECKGQTDYISTLTLENNQPGSTEPYFALELVPTDYTINNLSFTCPITVRTRVGNFAPLNAEQDNATIALQFYNLPLGEAYNNVADKVKDVKNDIDGVWEFIGQLQKFMNLAEKICKILNVIVNILNSLANILRVLDPLKAALDAIGMGEVVADAQTAICNPTEGTRQIYNFELIKYFHKFCNFLTCQDSLFDALEAVGAMNANDAKAAKEKVGNALGQDWFYKLLWPGSEKVQQQAKASLQPQADKLQNPNLQLNPRDSLVYSIVVPPLCIPGIIYNLDKWRQIKCQYGTCLLRDYRENGLPISVCENQRTYMECRFVTGEIFSLMPWAQLVNYYFNIIQQAFSDPRVLAGMGLAYILNCQKACTPGAKEFIGFQYWACAGLSLTSQLGQSINSIRSMKTVRDFGEVNTPWCEEFKDALKEFGG